jgi:ABC-2 type transport system permease protein
MSAATDRWTREPSAALAAPPWPRTMRAVIARGLRDQVRPALIWGAALGAMCALMVALWPSIEGSVDELMRSYPEGLKKVFGIEELDSVEKYLEAEMLSLIVPVALAVYAIRCVTRPTVAAEEHGHLDTLLSLPLSRSVLALASFVVAGLASALVLGVVYGVTIATGVVAGTGISAGTLAAGLGNVWPLATGFAGLAVLAAGLTRGAGRAMGIAAGTLVAMYVVDVVGKLADPVEPLRDLSAFRWYGSAVRDGLDVSHALALVLAGVALAALGAVLFERRDLA